MKFGRFVVGAAASAFLSSMLVGSTAGARSAGALQGNGGLLGNGCFGEMNGGVANLCGSQQVYEVAMPIDAAQSYTVVFKATSGTQCAAQVFSQTNVFVGSSGFSFSNGGLTTLTSSPVPVGGIIYLYCGIPANSGVLYSVNWF